MILGVNNEELGRAACIGVDPEVFFEKKTEREAQRTCAICPVRDVCLEDALAAELREYLDSRVDGRSAGIKLHGVYGGWTAEQRTGVVYRRAQQALKGVAA